MNRICKTCNVEIDENNYLKDRTVCKGCYNKNRRKNNNNTLIQNQNQKSETLKMTITMIMFQQLKITTMLLLGQETWAKPTTC